MQDYPHYKYRPRRKKKDKSGANQIKGNDGDVSSKRPPQPPEPAYLQRVAVAAAAVAAATASSKDNSEENDPQRLIRLKIIKWLPQQRKLFVVQTSLRHFFKQSKTCANVRIYRYKFLQCRVLKPICARDEIFSNTPTLCNTLCSNHTIKILCTV